jgi:Glycosyl transferase family 2
MSPKVSVLLAVHDGEPYVRDCVASVLGQTFGDFEFLIVDDASSDGTATTIESFGDRRIRLLRNERNLGQVPSLNRGLREARGDYVARIDHDDTCRPTRLERQVAVLDAQAEVGFVGSWLELVDEGGRRLGRLRSTIADFAELVYHTLIMRVLIAHPAATYRRAPVLELGGYDESTAPAEDKDLWRKLVLERWDGRIVPEPLVVYRLHAAQLSQTRAAYQRDVDGRSQERFLAALSPDAPVHALRLLLAGDPAFWDEDADAALEGLERLLTDARGRLRLCEAEARRLEGLVAGRLVEVAAAQPWRRSARAVLRHGLRRLTADQRLRAAAAVALAPVREGVRRAGRGVADAPGMTALRRPVKRSRLARRLYGKLVGGG